MYNICKTCMYWQDANITPVYCVLMVRGLSFNNHYYDHCTQYDMNGLYLDLYTCVSN